VIPNKLEDKGRFMNRLKPNKDEMESVARTIKSEIAKLS
jgi:hypothetical protein